MAILSAPPESVDRSFALLRDSLSRIQSTTDQMLSQLSAVERRLSALDSSVRAALMNASSTSTAHENIERSLNTADSLLTRLDVLRQANLRKSNTSVTSRIWKGPQIRDVTKRTRQQQHTVAQGICMYFGKRNDAYLAVTHPWIWE